MDTQGRSAGQVAVVTGAAGGIGRALAVAYAAHGVRTVVGPFPGDPHDPAQTAAAVRAAGGECVVHEGPRRWPR
ncbi:SDR family NAD(P)-dependent oxidoreductase [Streptomyces tubercidicus]|uniref:SDR family NAD(P)-dependent oxidoreductase n=1 Tax=Streptomyces tubercidicus TaxID=47759 RepID=UPI00368A6681